MKPFVSFLVPVVALALVNPAAAKKNNPNLSLDFRPQQSVAVVVPSLSGEMLDKTVALEFVDKRRGDEPMKIGMRGDDDDRRHELHATSDVGEFVQKHFVETANDWGIEFDSESELTLEVELIEVNLMETNQAVGATYNATVRLAYSLRQGSSEPRAAGSIPGDATRYGKKFSNENLNEVLSDAMLEAFADLFSDSALQRAWGE